MIAGAAIAAATRLMTGAVVEWQCDRHPRSSRIYFANHASHLDFVVVWSALPPDQRSHTRPVAGRTYWERNGMRRYLSQSVFRALLVDRASGPGDAVAVARASVERMARALEQGVSLIVFPEGTRSPDGNVGSFKSGLYHLSCLRPEAELVPVHLENLNRILPKGEMLPVPMLSRVVFGAPFRSSTNDKDAFLTDARHALISLRVS